MVKPEVRMLASDPSHLPLLLVWRDSGVTERHGFKLKVDAARVPMPGQEIIPMSQRGPLLLDGTYDFLSGLHHEPYYYRARGDKRFIYIAQAQNDWDDRIIATQEIASAKDLEGKRIIVTSTAPCVYGNLKHSIELGGADLGKVEFVTMADLQMQTGIGSAVEAVAKGEAVAANVDAPFDLQGEKLGLHRLETPSVPVIHNATMCANGEWVQDNEETTYAFLRSMVDAIHFFKTEPQRVCEIIEREVAPGLANLPVAAYWATTRKRFANPAVDHRLDQIAQDGPFKLAQRVFPLIETNRQAGLPVEKLAAIVRAWMSFAGKTPEEAIGDPDLRAVITGEKL